MHPVALGQPNQRTLCTTNKCTNFAIIQADCYANEALLQTHFLADSEHLLAYEITKFEAEIPLLRPYHTCAKFSTICALQRAEQSTIPNEVSNGSI